MARFGVVRVEVDKGVGSAQPGATKLAPAPFVAMAHMYFNSLGDVTKFIASVGDAASDLPNYTNIQPHLQISEIL
jgi:uncharacterized protein (TIGR02118 family)